MGLPKVGFGLCARWRPVWYSDVFPANGLYVVV